MLKELVICGAGGFAREVLGLVRALNHAVGYQRYAVLGFIDDDTSKKGTLVHGLPILGTTDEWVAKRRKPIAAVLGVGSPALKRQFVDRLCPSTVWPNLIHPNVDWKRAVENGNSLGRGCVICAGNNFTVDITLGDFVIANLNCTFGHDVKIANFSTILPGANISGNVHIGQSVTICTNATILEKRQIGDEAIVGAGAVVTKDVANGIVVVGAPAKRLERN